MSTDARSCRKQRNGAALVEMAMVLPVILLFFFGLIEISRMLLLQHTADTAAYEGARGAMVPGGTAADAIAASKDLLAAAGLVDCEVVVTPTEITEETALITVQVDVPVAVNSWVTPQFFTDMTVTSEVTLFCERSPLVRLNGLPQLKAKKNSLLGLDLGGGDDDDG